MADNPFDAIPLARQRSPSADALASIGLGDAFVTPSYDTPDVEVVTDGQELARRRADFIARETMRRQGDELRARADALRNPATFLDDLRAFGASEWSGLGSALRGVGGAWQLGYNKLVGEPLTYLTGSPQTADNPFDGLANAVEGVGSDIRSRTNAGYEQLRRDNQVGGDLFDLSSWTLGENPSLRGQIANALDVAGSMAPVLAATYLSGGSALAGAGIGGAQGGGAAIEQAQQSIDDLYAAGQLAQASDVFRNLIAGGMSDAEALAETKRRAGEAAFALTTPISALGGAATAKITSPASALLAGRSLPTRVLGSGALSALEEGAQETGEGIATQAGTNAGAGTDLDVLAGAFGNAFLGALGGAGPGALGGALRTESAAQRPGYGPIPDNTAPPLADAFLADLAATIERQAEGAVAAPPIQQADAANVNPFDALPDVTVAPEPTADLDAMLGNQIVPPQPEAAPAAARTPPPVLDERRIADALGAAPEPTVTPPAGFKGEATPAEAQPTILAREEAPAPEPEAPTHGDPLSVRNEIGWLQQGGRMLRAQPDEASLNDEERAGAVDLPKGEVIGRTQWMGHPDPQGNESTLWRNRPDKRLKPEQANAALDKYAAGEKLSPIEQRFVDYAADVAGEYQRVERALQAETDAYTQAERVASVQALREEVTDLADADQGEALNVYELAHRAASAGVSEMDIAPFAGETQPAYAARLWNLIAEQDNGADTRAAGQDRQESDRRREGGQARQERPGLEEPERALEKQRGAVAPQEVSRGGQGGLFAPPTARETVEAEQRRRDDERNGKTGTGRTDMAAGRGELFAGPRPEQADIEAPATPVPKAETPPAPAEEPARVTGTKNAVTDAERSAAGRDPIVTEAAKGNEEALAEAVQALQDDPTIGAATVAKLSRAGVEGISLADEAVLLVHKTELLNKRDAAAQKLADPKADEDTKDAARQAWEAAEAEITAIDIAAKNAGREWGRFGQFRQRMLREDFTFEALERKERARLERPLTADESAKIKTMAEQIEALQKRVDEFQAKAANAESEWALEHMTRRVTRPAQSRDRLTTLRAAADAARKRLRETADVPSKHGQSGAVISPTVFADLATIGAYHIANGAVTLADWVKAVTAEVGEWFADLKDDHFNLFNAAKREVDNFADPVDEVLSKIDLNNITAKDVRKLIAAHVGAGLRGEKAVISAVANDLGLAEDEVRALFVESARREQTLTEAQQELSDLRKLVRLQEEIDRLEAGRPKPEPGKPQQDSPAVAEKKAELADLRKRLRPARDPEGRYQEMRGKQIAKRIEELQRRIAAGDFAPRPRVPRALTEANQRAMYELDKAKEAFLRHQFEDNLRKRTPVAKAFGVVGDVFNLARAVMTSFDLSAVLRQGGFITYSHPLRALSSISPSLKAFVSEANEHKTNTEISNRKNAPLYKKFGLQLTGIGAGPLTQIEEAYASRWLSKLPWWTGAGLVRGSGRAYVAFLNKLRADSFDAMVATLAKSTTPTDKEGKAIANYINVATGRGKVGTNETAAQTLNTVFFAPRLVASRFQLLAGQPLYGGTARTRKLVAQEYARFLLGLGVVMSLTAFALGAGDDDEDKPMIGLDPRSSDFGKIRIGKTYLDPLAGLAQVTVLLSRLATGETVSGSGAVKPLRPDYTLTDLRRALGEDLPAHKLGEDGKLPFGSGNAAEVIGRFLRTKLAPVPGAIINALAGTNVIGDQVTPAQAAGELVVPMSFQNIGDIMEESGVPKGTAITLLGLLGMGVQHRGTNEAQATKESLGMADDAKAEIEDRLSTLPMGQWAGELDKMKEKYGPLMEGVSLAIYKKDGKYGKAGEPKRTSTGAPVLEFEGKDGEGSVLGELDGYPGYGAKGAYTTQGVNDRIEALRKMGNRLAGEQALTRDAVVKLTEPYQMQVPAAQALFDAVQANGDGDVPIDRKTRDAIAGQVKFLRKAEMAAGAQIVDEAKAGKAPDYNRAKALVKKAIDAQYGD